MKELRPKKARENEKLEGTRSPSRPLGLIHTASGCHRSPASAAALHLAVDSANPSAVADSPPPCRPAPPGAIPSITQPASCNPRLDPAPPPLNPILTLPPNPHRQLPTPTPPTHAAVHSHPRRTRIPAQSHRRIRSKSGSTAAGSQIHHDASRSTVPKSWSLSTRFDQIHVAQGDLTEKGEKDHREVFMARFMFQILAHNRRCSDPSIWDKEDP
ncbi:uncharacterized protein [Aegilops tauschii subsp. strangulata]|uniref:uncharacterized protein n=1 Tax=Aegilops tauschii subsp. strangulata TaxID=200361 RepID=UPI00098AE88F|nr:acrosin [Aegilops tauschii subsp. strangulata]XP_044355839.1 acrosin-like isoform X2 [Triticum aestivum]XP_044355840.1 acrosin-like isoform X2 [Triticum aestivum]